MICFPQANLHLRVVTQPHHLFCIQIFIKKGRKPVEIVTRCAFIYFTQTKQDSGPNFRQMEGNILFVAQFHSENPKTARYIIYKVLIFTEYSKAILQ